MKEVEREGGDGRVTVRLLNCDDLVFAPNPGPGRLQVLRDITGILYRPDTDQVCWITCFVRFESDGERSVVIMKYWCESGATECKYQLDGESGDSGECGQDRPCCCSVNKLTRRRKQRDAASCQSGREQTTVNRREVRGRRVRQDNCDRTLTQYPTDTYQPPSHVQPPPPASNPPTQYIVTTNSPHCPLYSWNHQHLLPSPTFSKLTTHSWSFSVRNPPGENLVY